MLFDRALPVWEEGKEKEKNITCGFRTEVAGRADRIYLLRIAAQCTFRVYVNGEFLSSGPARAAHDFYRVDELPMQLREGVNIIAIEVAGYNINNFCTLNRPSFCQAEVLEDGAVIAATGRDFLCKILPDRVQRVQKYSFQRPFVEVYRLNAQSRNWRTAEKPEEDWHVPAILPEKQLLKRNIPLYHFTCIPAAGVIDRGTFESGGKPQHLYKDRSLVDIGSKQLAFSEQELEICLSDEFQSKVFSSHGMLTEKYDGCELTIEKDSYTTFAWDFESTGFLGAELRCDAPSVVEFIFDEKLRDGDVMPQMECVNIIRMELQPGAYSLLSFEPYGMKFCKILAQDGSVQIKGLHLREYACSIPIRNMEDITPADVYGNSALREIFHAAVNTFRQNAVDVFMDCPTRERAGWLCDSFFTSRTERVLTGQNGIERNFLENFLLPESFEHIPKGMLPMCYPSDHYDGVFIPNWAMWFVIELEDYVLRGGEREFALRFRRRVTELLEYFSAFENESGLLEHLESWVFLEWSKANELTQDVNFPTNMLYAGMLEAAGRLFGEEEWVLKGKMLRDKIGKMSFDGSFFVDNALRRDGELILSGERTETCQYYAFFFEIATPTSHPELWERITNEFGPDRSRSGLYPEIYPSNAFIGNYLRLDVLYRYGLKEKVYKEIEGYFFYMAEQTGTLWENITSNASCNHGFASYVIYLMQK